MAGALATVMLGAWPEPFGLVAIESMATGTPVIARRAGACTETIEHGVTGFLVDDAEEARLALERIPALDRRLIRSTARERFSAERMVEGYEAAFRTLLRQRETHAIGDPREIAETVSTIVRSIPKLETSTTGRTGGFKPVPVMAQEATAASSRIRSGARPADGAENRRDTRGVPPR
jgi:hypothetical protein